VSPDKIAVGKISILDGSIVGYKSEQGSLATSHGSIMFHYEPNF